MRITIVTCIGWIALTSFAWASNGATARTHVSTTDQGMAIVLLRQVIDQNLLQHAANGSGQAATVYEIEGASQLIRQYLEQDAELDRIDCSPGAGSWLCELTLSHGDSSTLSMDLEYYHDGTNLSAPQIQFAGG